MRTPTRDPWRQRHPRHCLLSLCGPEAALALSLVKRLPDLVLGVPGLIAWQAMEGWNFHARGRAQEQKEQA